MNRIVYMIAVLIISVTAHAQYTNSFTVNPASVVDVYLTHKAYSQAKWLADIAGVDLTDHTPITCGIKSALSDNTFFALSTGTVVSATAGTVLFSFPCVGTWTG